MLNFDDVAIESVEFEPPADGSEGIVVSMQELVEVIKNDGTTGTTTSDSGSGASQYLATTDVDDDAVYYQKSSEANYEINQTKTLIENSKGKIEDLSVAIILNSETGGEDYTQNVKQLVANAIGVDMDRITVETLPFLAVEQETDTTDPFIIQQQLMSDVQDKSTLRLVITLIAGLIVMIIIFLIFKMFKPKNNKLAAEGADWEEGIDVMADEEITPDMINNNSNKRNSTLILMTKTTKLLYSKNI